MKLHEGQDTKSILRRFQSSLFVNKTRPTMKDINSKCEKNSGVVTNILYTKSFGNIAQGHICMTF